jgi:ABC-2 type transport system ATP-binding protein
MQQTADHLIVIGRGRLIADAGTSDVLTGSGARTVRVRTSDPLTLERMLLRAGAEVQPQGDGTLVVTGMSGEAIGLAARELDLTLHELTTVSSSLEEVYLELTADSLDYAAADGKEPS